jgi:glycosyltransferase involved in cell wall biosynthesis
LREVVDMPGALPHAQVLAHMRESHAFVMPSVRAADGDIDGIPNVVLEAMALGRPVIASRLSGIPEVVHDGHTGYLVPPGDAHALAQALARLDAAREDAQRLGASGRALVEQRFDVQVSARETLAAVSETLAAHRTTDSAPPGVVAGATADR